MGGLWAFSGPDPLRITLPFGFGPLFALIPSQDRLRRPQEWPRTASRGSRAAQHHQQNHKGGPRPPTQAPRAAQDRTQRPQERPKTTHTGPSTSRSTIHRKCRRKISKKKHAARQLHDRPSIENIKEKRHRQNMLSVNFRSDRRAICPLTMSLYSDRPTLVSIYIYIYIY